MVLDSFRPNKDGANSFKNKLMDSVTRVTVTTEIAV
jgi:hypothetical protein